LLAYLPTGLVGISMLRQRDDARIEATADAADVLMSS
jgi:hypothetical protein